MEEWNQPNVHNCPPRGLREQPLMVLAGVAAFITCALILAGILLRDDDPNLMAGSLAGRSSPTATASSTPEEGAPTATGTTATATQPATTTIPAPPPATAASAGATVASEPATTPVAGQPTDQPAQTSEARSIALLDLLPNLEDLPEGFVVTTEGTLALDEVAEVHPDPAMQRQRLRGWGFTGAAERQFELEPGTAETPERMTILAVLIVEFRTAEDARAAVEASHADAQAAENTDVSNAEIEPLGDLSLAASGTLTIDGETLQVAYVIVQIGNRAISFAGGSPTGDPLAEVFRVASRTLDSL